jgi:predicted secreted protein
MAPVVGYNGKVMVGAATVAEIGEWSLDIEAEMLDTTKFGDQWKAAIAGLKSWSGSFAGRFDTADATGQIALQSATLGGTTVALKLYTDATHNYSGTAFITTTSPKAAVDGTVDVDFSFEGTGTLAYA